MNGGYDSGRLLGALVAGDVEFVLIGSLAGALHGSSLVGVGVELCPSRTARNLGALARVLEGLAARPRGAAAPVVLDGAVLARADSYRFLTTAGPLDCIGTPRGTTGYPDLVRRAVPLVVGDGLTVRAAALADLIRMRRAADHAKDRAELEVLEALRDELAASGG